jgi:hypothetical protein
MSNVAMLYRAALGRLEAASLLDARIDAPSAIALYRDAMRLLVSAAAIAEQSDGDDWNAIAAIAKRRGTPLHPRWEELRAIVTKDDPAFVDTLPPSEAASLREAFAEATSELCAMVEPRTPQEIRKTRRLGKIAGIVASALIVVWLLDLAIRPRNVALGKEVTTSSRHPTSPDPGGATNGEIESTFGVHTNVEDEPWIQVDLGRPHLIKRVRVYARGDGYEEEGVPLVIELSPNANAWREVARRDKPYGQLSPWVARIDTQRGRYVRVRMPRRGYIALAEIEVNGDPE